MDLTFLPSVINDAPTPERLREIAQAEIRMMKIALKVANNIHIRCRLGESQNWRCCWCGDECVPEPNTKKSATIEHVHPRSLGGADEWENYAMACAACNHSRGTISVEDFMSGKTTQAIQAAYQERKRAAARRKKAMRKYMNKAQERNVTGWVRADGSPLCKTEWLESLGVNKRYRRKLEKIVYGESNAKT